MSRSITTDITSLGSQSILRPGNFEIVKGRFICASNNLQLGNGGGGSSDVEIKISHGLNILAHFMIRSGLTLSPAYSPMCPPIDLLSPIVVTSDIVVTASCLDSAVSIFSGAIH
jgi:hypothetical protein